MEWKLGRLGVSAADSERIANEIENAVAALRTMPTTMEWRFWKFPCGWSILAEISTAGLVVLTSSKISPNRW